MFDVCFISAAGSAGDDNLMMDADGLRNTRAVGRHRGANGRGSVMMLLLQKEVVETLQWRVGRIQPRGTVEARAEIVHPWGASHLPHKQRMRVCGKDSIHSEGVYKGATLPAWRLGYLGRRSTVLSRLTVYSHRRHSATRCAKYTLRVLKGGYLQESAVADSGDLILTALQRLQPMQARLRWHQKSQTSILQIKRLVRLRDVMKQPPCKRAQSSCFYTPT